MESHIERLVAACGLRHFGYRQFGAPELVIPERVVVPEASAPPLGLMAEAEPGGEHPAPILPAIGEAPPPPMMQAAAAARPPIILALPPEPNTGIALPAYPDWAGKVVAAQGRPPVSLPPPGPLPLAGAMAEPPPRGRPPVVLPSPETFDASMSPPPPVAKARAAMPPAPTQPRFATERRLVEGQPAESRAVAEPPIRLPPVAEGQGMLRPLPPRPPVPRPVSAQPRQPARRFALLDEIRPPSGDGGHDRPSAPHSP